MPVLGTTQQTKLIASDGAGWTRLGAVPTADAVAKAKGNAKDDVVAQVGKDVFVATTTHLDGPATPGSAIDLLTPEGDHLAGAIVYADRESPPPPLPAWKKDVSYAGFGAMILGFGAVALSMCGVLASAIAMPAFIVGGAGFLALGLATNMQL